MANKGKCIFCHDTSQTPDHKSCDCPILKKLRLQLAKRSDTAYQEAASRVTAQVAPTPSAPTLAPAPPPVPPLPSDLAGGSTVLPSGFSAAAELDAYDSGYDYDYEGKAHGVMYTNGGPRSI
jgi:hypothetical protein